MDAVIDPGHALASWFLLIGGGFFLVVFALPLALAPLTWARWFGWRVAEAPADQDLLRYFGRCLGATALALVFAIFRAAPAPAEHLATFDLLIVAACALALVHVAGAVERRQPWIETAEIGLYGGFAAALIWIRATLP